MSYNFGELRKTVAAAGGLALTGVAYVLADDQLREFIPPQWVAVLGAVATIFGVFHAKDDRIADPNNPAQAIRVALDSMSKAKAKIESDTVAINAQQAAVAEAVGSLGSTLTPSGTTPFSLPPTALPPFGSPVGPVVLTDLDHQLIDAYRDDEGRHAAATA